MAREITFLHTADLHIGAPMRGFRDLSDAWASRLQRAICEAYDRIVDAALKNAVDFVVVAGDVFDTSGASYGDFLHFFEGLQRLDDAGIPVFMVPGNHDPLSSWRNDLYRLPPSCRMMGGEEPEYALFERDGEPLCLIAARGYRNQAWASGERITFGVDRAHAVKALSGEFPLAEKAPFCVGIVHTGLEPDQSKAYSNLQELVNADVDYWACGHLHKRLLLPAKSHPRVSFPGCIQGRDLKESGERGCSLVTMRVAEDAPVQVELEFVPTASVVFHTVEVDVSACQTLADIAHLIQAQLFHVNGHAACDEMVERVVLVGKTRLHGYLRLPDVLRDLRKRINNAYPSFYCDALVDHTKPLRDRDAVLAEGLFESHALRVSDEQRASAAQMINYIQAEFVKRGIDVPSSLAEHVRDFNDIAETLVMDLLAEEEL